MPYIKKTWATGNVITANDLNNNENGTEWAVKIAEAAAKGLGFGDGSDGDFNPGVNTTFSVAVDGGPVIKQYRSIDIPAGVTVTTDNRCKGLFLLCTGNVTISGTIHMNDRAARVSRATESPTIHTYNKLTNQMFQYAIVAGGNGGNGGGATNNGYGGSNCAYGGSGGGGGRTTPNEGSNGGIGAGSGGAGGAGSGGGQAGAAGGNGGGGLIVMSAAGSITINTGGLVHANSTGAGGKGGDATGPSHIGGGGGGAGNGGFGGGGGTGLASDASGGHGGGGAGGGVVVISCAASYINNGSIQVNGSVGGAGGAASGTTNNINGSAGQSGQAGAIVLFTS